MDEEVKRLVRGLKGTRDALEIWQAIRRDVFAGLALAGFAAVNQGELTPPEAERLKRSAALAAVKWADALVTELDKSKRSQAVTDESQKSG